MEEPWNPFEEYVELRKVTTVRINDD